MNQDKSMLAGPKQKILTELIAGSSKEDLIWINGFISGILNGQEETPDGASTLPVAPQKITLVYGTETGNSKKVATELAAKAKKNKCIVKLASLDQYRLTDLTREEKLFVVISTQGDGEPPVAAQKFYDHIHLNGFRLDQLQYSVLALGDTSYPMFCKTGEEVDAQLEKLGGQRIVPICKCDVDYEADAAAWFAEVLQAVHQTVVQKPVVLKVVAEPVAKSNKIIYTGSVIANTNLIDQNPEKEMYHIELIAEAVDYQPGDSIGIVPENPAELVQEIIAITGIDPQKTLYYKDTAFSITDLLQQKLNIVYLHERVVKKYAAITSQDIPEIKMDLLNLLQLYPVKDAAMFEEVLLSLPVQAPRIYTIASSPSAHGGEIHLTVEKDFFEIDGQKRTGLCSGFLSGKTTGASLDFFVQKNKRFRLPADSKDIILVSPGTGIASARSFLHERDATGATGKNWLFFGEDHFVSDFLYQTEIQDWQQTGLLTHVSLAFAKDKPEEESVPQKIREEAVRFFQWLESGAYLYISGEKLPMSTEVEEAIQWVIAEQGGFSREDAAKYFDQLKEAGRYAKDVY